MQDNNALFALQDKITDEQTRIREADQQIRSLTFLIGKHLQAKSISAAKIEQYKTDIEKLKGKVLL